MGNLIDFNEVLKAYERVKMYIHLTPLVTHKFINNAAGTEVYLKLENFQRTGSFKARGAFNKILSISEDQRKKGIVTASSGNHGAAVAYAGRILGIPTTIVVPETVIKAKLKAIEGYEGKVVVWGTTSDERRQKAEEIAEREGKTFIHSFDDPHIIAGQGTIAHEILNQMGDIQTILVPIGGGGLISGISLIKQKHPHVKIIGVEPAGNAKMKLSIDNNSIMPFPKVNTIADGLRAKQPGNLTYEIAKKYVDLFVTVDDTEIYKALLLLLERGKTLAEPSGVVTLAYAVKGELKSFKKIACVVSGGNIGMDRLAELYSERQKLLNGG
ncbi:MAG: threonine/serine dehydratase [Firmicutes bacterium]|nr:threonine/serine dehydratase [Bacillota bacterium]